MAAAKHLPVYKEASRLVNHLYATTKKAPRELRFTLVQRFLSESVELLVDIDAANRSSKHERLSYIREAQKRAVRVSVLLATAYEQRCLSRGALALCIESMAMLEKQLFGWARHTESGLALSRQSELGAST
jgi:hypothetical protein